MTTQLAVVRGGGQSVGAVVMNAGVLYATKEGKHGDTVGMISQKAYGQEYGLKGQELKRAHAEYRRENGLKFNMNIGAALTGGKIVAQKLTPTANGFNVTFVRPEVLEVKPGKNDKVTSAVKVATAEVTAKAVVALMAKLGCTEGEALAML